MVITSRARFVPVLLLAGALAAGCSITVSQSPSPTPSAPAPTSAAPRPAVSPLVLPSPSGKPLTKAQAAARYQKIVELRNGATGAIKKVEDEKGTWQAHQAAVTELIKAEDAVLVQLGGVAWPADVRPHVDALLQLKLAHREQTYAVVAAQTQQEYLAALNAVPAKLGCREVSAVKVALGLPAVEGCPSA